MIQREITSVQSLLEALSEDNGGYAGAIWYRGHARADWQLMPGFMRLEGQTSEATLLKRFKQSAAMLIESKRLPKAVFPRQVT